MIGRITVVRGAEEFQKTEIDAREFIEFSDPLERMNRSIGVFNHGMIFGVADPLWPRATAF